MLSRKVRRIYPMQRALRILLDRALSAPADARKAALTKAVAIHCLTRPEPLRF